MNGQIFDYIVVMSYAADEICEQLRNSGIPDEKVVLHSQLCMLKRSQLCICHNGRENSIDDWFLENKKCVLLISHNYNYTGIPVVLMNMAKVLRKMGYSVLMAAMDGGPFTRELELRQIAYMENLAFCYGTPCFRDMLNRFEAVVIGTFALYRMVMSLKDITVPVMWWVHETSERYYIGKENLPFGSNIRFLAGGSRVKKFFGCHYENARIDILQYCIPDSYKNVQAEKFNSQMLIAVIGTVDERKAQDILLEAIIRMPLKCKDMLRVVMIGELGGSSAFAEKIGQQVKQLNNLEWIQEMTQDKLDDFFENIDILVCPSREDPMPVVVTQAMMHGKVCVISENVGQAEFILQQKNGFVFPSEDMNALMGILMWLVNNRDKCAEIGKASRGIYEKEFSEEIMKKKLDVLLEDVCGKKDVQV